MGIAILLSASGSPGVTATALALGITTPTPTLVVEADISRASDMQAGYFRGQVSAAERGLNGVAALASASRLDAVSIEREQTGINDTTAVVLGFSSPTAGHGAASLWGPLASAISEISLREQHVIVDAGHWTIDDPRVPLLAVADQVLLITRAQLPSLAAARPLAAHLRTLPQMPDASERVGVVVRKSVPDGYDSATIARLLGLPVVGSLADDARGAAIFAHGTDATRGTKRAFVKDVTSIGREMVGKFAVREQAYAEAARQQRGILQ